jgi:hypothetical protein
VVAESDMRESRSAIALDDYDPRPFWASVPVLSMRMIAGLLASTENATPNDGSRQFQTSETV